MAKKVTRPDTAALFVRMTKKEHDTLHRIAKEAGFSNASEWLRVVKLRKELSLANA
jgi:LysM repeat protein